VGEVVAGVQFNRADGCEVQVDQRDLLLCEQHLIEIEIPMQQSQAILGQ